MYSSAMALNIISLDGLGDEDDKKDQPKEQDADFNAKTLADKQQTSASKDDARDK